MILHYYKFNISDWRSSTSHLSLEEESIYLRLINYYYAKESIIPLDLTLTLRKLSLINHADLVLIILDEFFTKTDQGWKKSKCDEILKEYKKTAGKNKKNGAKGGRPNKIAVSSISQEKPTGLIVATQEKPTGNPNQELLTTNHKPVTIKKNKRRVFIKPTPSNISDFQIAENLNLTNFFDYYESNGWKVGKNSMKDWQAAARGWSKRQSQYSSNQPDFNDTSTDWVNKDWGLL